MGLGLRRAELTSDTVQACYDRLLNWFLLGWSVLQRGERARALDALSYVHRFLLQLARVRENSLGHWLTPSRNLELELSAGSQARLRMRTADLSPGALESAYRQAWSWSQELVGALAASHSVDARSALARQIDHELQPHGE